MLSFPKDLDWLRFLLDTKFVGNLETRGNYLSKFMLSNHTMSLLCTILASSGFWIQFPKAWWAFHFCKSFTYVPKKRLGDLAWSFPHCRQVILWEFMHYLEMSSLTKRKFKKLKVFVEFSIFTCTKYKSHYSQIISFSFSTPIVFI